MSIQVENLVKVYGEQQAVNNISFTAQPGEVLGFLGPNGAGKTTTMKIITCYLPQTAGKVTVCGHDTTEESLEVRRQIGYLPEHNPLYKDMYVREYLNFAARVTGLKKPAGRISELIEMTGLGREQHKLIGALSKGYRQRVGLAQAMLHDPQVLILDEPTSGLDPNQLVEIRKLIKELGQEKTVIFSTHIMQEVQALCDRVLIIDRGNLVADDPIENLQNRLGASGHSLLIELSKAVKVAALEKINGVTKVRKLAGEGNHYRLFTKDEKVDVRPDVFRYVVAQDLILLGMEKEAASVEDVFRQLTQKTAEA